MGLLLLSDFKPISVFDKFSATFNGTTSTMSVASVSNLNFTTSCSMSFWVKTTNTSGSFPGIIGKWDSGLSSRQYFVYFNPSFQAEFFVSGDGVSFIGVSSSVINDGNWHFIACTYDGSIGTIKIYVDGTISNVATGAPAILNTSSAPFTIGSDTNNGSPTDFWQGKLDEAAVYSSVLTALQITTLYNAGVPNDISGTPGLVSWWRFENNSNDSFGTNNATATNVTYSTDVP